MKSVSYNYFMDAMVMNSKLEPIINNESKDCAVEEYYDDNNRYIVGKACHSKSGDVDYRVLENL